MEQAAGLLRYYEELIDTQWLNPQATAAIKAKLVEWKRLILK